MVNPVSPTSFPSRLRRLTINGALLDPTAFSRFIPGLVNLEELELKSVRPDLVRAVGYNGGIDGTDHADSPVASVTLRLR